MKNAKSSPRVVAAALSAILLSVQTTHAVVTTWNNAGGGLWSVGGNWDTLNAPVAADDARFVNVGAGNGTTLDVSRTINSLVFAQDNQSLHTTTINPGQTLTVSRGNAGDVINVGSTGGATTASTLTPATITGPGGTLTISGTGNLVVRQGNSANGSHMATLDLSGLDTFNANIGRLLVGQANAGDPINRPSGTLILARTNHITLGGGSPQVMIQDSGQNANTATCVLSFGQVTELFSDVMRFGGQKGNANITFNGAFSAPSLKLRSSNTVDRVAIIDFGYNGAANSGNNTICTADLSAGVVDLSANLVNLAIGNPGASAGTCTSTLTIGAGSFNANTLEIGFGIATGANGAATATFNVNNNGLQSTGAVLVVNNTMRLARTNGGTGAILGTLNINGGTVIASNIVSGGGVSTINVNTSGKLVVTGTAGSLATPIRVFSMTDGTLNIPAPIAGATVAVSNLTAGGSQNLINITSIPPISSYPATFTLIAYQSGAGGNFALGTLPAATPSYSGTIVESAGVVTLQLTAGPVVDLSMRWTGANGNSWDSFSQNWLYQGNPTNFFSGAAVLFNDNTTQNSIFLSEALSPGSVTVSNNTLPFDFNGSGNIAGAAFLSKRGSGTLVIENTGVDNFGSVTITSGILQIGNGGTDGAISALNITNNSSLIVNRSGSYTLSSGIYGTGSLTKSGDGALTLSGPSSYSGATILSGGTLQIDGNSAGAGALTTSNGTVVAGSGTINGAATVRGRLNPGPIGTAGIFKAHNGLTLASGSTLTFDLSATDPSNPAANDSVEVFGNLAANNNVITVNIAGTPQPGANYLLFTYTGILSGSFNPTVLGTHFTASVDTSSPGAVYLTIGGSGASLKWGSFTDNIWDTSTTNWLDINSSAQSLFLSGDTTLLDDLASQNGIVINSGVTVYPAIITNSSTNNYYTINGGGRIGGSASIVKSGPSTLVLGNANTFTGPVDIQEGMLQTDSDTALGTTASGTTIYDGATLSLNGRNLGGEFITVSGAGVGGQGAIVNNGTTQNQALRQILMTGDTTFGGSALWAMNNGGGAASLSTGGNSFNLTKVGGNQVNLAQVATVDSALADIDIQQGTIEFSGLTTSMGDPFRTNYVRQGATLAFANGTVSWNKNFNFDGDGSGNTVTVGTSANTTLLGSVEVHGNPIFNVTGTMLTISVAISGDGGLIKNGNSPMVLNNVNTYTGDTRINAGALRLNGTASIANSPTITIATGTLTVTGRVDSTFTMVTGQILKGNGVVSGLLVESAGSTISPGLDAIGALTVSNAVTLLGTTTMELDAANGTNDVLRSGSSITYGGTLNLVSLNDPLPNGATFKLFNATSYPGTFSAINPPTPGPGQTWDTSTLGTTGTIKVVGSGPTLPTFAPPLVQGSNLIMSGSNGVASGSYYVLSSTDLSLPLSSWTRIATNSFNGSGNFSFTNTINPTTPKRFFSIQLP